MIWHVINLLKKKSSPKTIAIIGDGKANFVINALINFKNEDIFHKSF